MKTTHLVFTLSAFILLASGLRAQTLDDQIARLRTLSDQGLGPRHPTIRSLVQQVDELRRPTALTSDPDYMALRAERISLENAITVLTLPPAPGLPNPIRPLKGGKLTPFLDRLTTIDDQLADLETQIGHHWSDPPTRNPK